MKETYLKDCSELVKSYKTTIEDFIDLVITEESYESYEDLEFVLSLINKMDEESIKIVTENFSINNFLVFENETEVCVWLEKEVDLEEASNEPGLVRHLKF